MRKVNRVPSLSRQAPARDLDKRSEVLFGLREFAVFGQKHGQVTACGNIHAFSRAAIAAFRCLRSCARTPVRCATFANLS